MVFDYYTTEVQNIKSLEDYLIAIGKDGLIKSDIHGYEFLIFLNNLTGGLVGYILDVDKVLECKRFTNKGFPIWETKEGVPILDLLKDFDRDFHIFDAVPTKDRDFYNKDVAETIHNRALLAISFDNERKGDYSPTYDYLIKYIDKSDDIKDTLEELGLPTELSSDSENSLEWRTPTYVQSSLEKVAKVLQNLG